MEDQIGAIQDHPGAVEACAIEVLTGDIQAYPRDAKGPSWRCSWECKGSSSWWHNGSSCSLTGSPLNIVESHLAVIKAYLRMEKLTLELNSSFCSGAYFGVLGFNPEPCGIPWSTGGYPKVHGHIWPTIDQFEDLDANFEAKRSLPYNQIVSAHPGREDEHKQYRFDGKVFVWGRRHSTVLTRGAYQSVVETGLLSHDDGEGAGMLVKAI